MFAAHSAAATALWSELIYGDTNRFNMCMQWFPSYWVLLVRGKNKLVVSGSQWFKCKEIFLPCCTHIAPSDRTRRNWAVSMNREGRFCLAVRLFVNFQAQGEWFKNRPTDRTHKSRTRICLKAHLHWTIAMAKMNIFFDFLPLHFDLFRWFFNLFHFRFRYRSV